MLYADGSRRILCATTWFVVNVGIRRCGNWYIDHPTDRCVIILNRTSVLRVKCPACAHTPARRAPPVSRVLQRVHIGHDQYNQVLESVVIILYYNELRNRMINWNTKRNAINKALYPAKWKAQKIQQTDTHTHTHTRIRDACTALIAGKYPFSPSNLISCIEDTFLLRLMRRGSRGEQWSFMDDEANWEWFEEKAN